MHFTEHLCQFSHCSFKCFISESSFKRDFKTVFIAFEFFAVSCDYFTFIYFKERRSLLNKLLVFFIKAKWCWFVRVCLNFSFVWGLSIVFSFFVGFFACCWLLFTNALNNINILEKIIEKNII